MKKRLFVIGCTGSVGSSVLSVCRMFPEHFEVVAPAGNSSAERLLFLAEEFSCRTVVLADSSSAQKAAVPSGRSHTGIAVLSGEEGLLQMASHPDIDHVVFASSGTGAIRALMQALRNGKDVSLANKESIVVAGPWVLPLVARADQLRPLDSEHNAIWQCLSGESLHSVERIYLPASGGSFLSFSPEELERATPSMAVAHPVWSMGAKISVDSATLMNKGIEILEAMYLFSLSAAQVDAVISANPFIHGIVRFSDGSFHMCASAPDMGIPALSALFHPLRSPRDRGNTPRLDGMQISFQAPDESRFPSLRMAAECIRAGGAACCVLNAANEEAAQRLLLGELTVGQLYHTVEETLRQVGSLPADTLSQVMEADLRARETAQRIMNATYRKGTL